MVQCVRLEEKTPHHHPMSPPSPQIKFPISHWERYQSMLKRCFQLCLSLVFVSVSVAQIKVVDEDGAAVDRFETTWAASGVGYVPWTSKTIDLDLRSKHADAITVAARADGYATEVCHFEGDSLADLRAG